MIVLRRTLAVLFIIAFPLLLLGTLLALRVNATVLEPRFYTNTLERLDVFDFLYEEALPLTIDGSGTDLEGAPFGLQLTPATVTEYAKRVLPPEWLQENVAEIVRQVVPYAAGRTDSFTVEVRLDDRAEAASDVARDLVREARVHEFLMSEIVGPALERNAEAFEDLPFGLSLTAEQVEEGVAEVVPEEWLRQQALLALDEVLVYMTAKADGFQVVVPLQDRADAGIVILERWFLEDLEAEAYDYIIEQQVSPAVHAGMGDVVRLPYGVELTEEEVTSAVASALPPAWAAERLRDAVQATGAYLTGRTDDLRVVIPLQDRRDLIAQALVNVADSKLEAAYQDLDATCGMEEVQEFVQSHRTMPECRIEGMSYQDIKERTGLQFFDDLALTMLEPMPDSIVMDERTLLRGLDQEDIVSIRRLLRDGFVFTDGDLRRMLEEQGGPALEGRVDEVRGYVQEGIRFTDADLRTRSGDGFQQIESLRGAVGTFRSLLLLGLLLPVGIPVAVGFLGGRTWDTRLIWAGIPLVLGGGLAALAAGVAGGHFREITDAFIGSMDANPAIINKVGELRDELMRVFVVPITIQAAVAGCFGVAAMVGGVFLARRSGRIADGAEWSVQAFTREERIREQALVGER